MLYRKRVPGLYFTGWARKAFIQLPSRHFPMGSIVSLDRKLVKRLMLVSGIANLSLRRCSPFLQSRFGDPRLFTLQAHISHGVDATTHGYSSKSRCDVPLAHAFKVPQPRNGL